VGGLSAAPFAVSPTVPLGPAVCALAVTRAAPGCSAGPFARCNLGARSGDDPHAVAANRARLATAFALPSPPRFLRQVHGRTVVRFRGEEPSGFEPEADAAWTDRPGVVLAVLSADCVPVLIACADGSWVAVAHAGWRGLAAGVIPALLERLPSTAGRLRAWIGPAISAEGYEVGSEVREALLRRDPRHEACFQSNPRGRHQLDLRLAARQQLEAAGVHDIEIAPHATDREPALWYSHRRDGGRTGRFASLIWIEA
jgi:YfiH family protein